MAFPNFHGRRGENAGNFLDDLEMAFLVSGREDEEIKLRAFPLVLREEAKVWFQDLDMGKQGNWEALKRAFLLRYSADNNPEEIWRKLSKLQQESPDSYSEYETQFLKLWTQWENSLPEGERAPNFLQKERFLAGLTPILREKVKCKFPESFKEALTWARIKDRKLQFQRSWRDHSQATRRQAGGQGTNDKAPRRPPRREYQCHDYGEDEHGMYFCPYPRGYGNAPPRGPQQQVSLLSMRPPPMPMCEQQQKPQQHQPIQILRQSTYAPVPQPTTEVPPLPHDGVEQAMNVISYEDKGEEKIMEAEAMPGKQATIAKEPRKMTTNDGANKKEKKRKKKASMTRRKIGIINFTVKSKPHDLIEKVQRQEPKLTWPQLLHLSPGMRRQWSKMVSTRRSKSVNTLKAQVLEDDVPVLDTQIKGQRVSSNYVDEGAQVGVISEKRMHKLGLEVSGSAGFKADNVFVKYVGVVTVCGIQVGVDMYVLPARGEGYPIILGRPWLIAMNARQDWKSRTLLLKPPRKEGKSIQTIVYNVKEGRKESLELETSEDEWSTEDSSSTAEVTSTISDNESEKSSLLEAMGVVLTRPTTQDGGSIKETLSDEKIEDMLSTDLSKEERKEFEVMLQKHSPVFILHYKQIKGVTVFVELWERWVASLRLGEAAPDFLKKGRFVAGLCPPLKEKVKGRFLVTWMDARDIAHLKERKIRGSSITFPAFTNWLKSKNADDSTKQEYLKELKAFNDHLQAHTNAHVWMCGASDNGDLTKKECILERSVTDEAYIPEPFLEHLFEPFGWTQILSTLDICVNELTPTKFCDEEGYDLVTLQMASVILESGLESDENEDQLTQRVECKRIVNEISLIDLEKQTKDEFRDSLSKDLPLLEEDF
ncbi:hypothetical protein L7F22_005301 [Adiantum nelumboides]|nr:hypothetical protein [Adiantum nelumboides]